MRPHVQSNVSSQLQSGIHLGSILKEKTKKAPYFTDICVSLLAHVILENASERENRHGTVYQQCSKSPCGVLALRILVVAQKACGQKQTFILSQAQLSRD